MTDSSNANTPDQRRLKVLGTRPIRHDGLEKVTGKARFAADVLPQATLHGKILRSPHAHARIRKINTSKAMALPGVRAVITHRDLPVVRDGVMDMGESSLDAKALALNSLADGKVLYKGHAVAAVAATSPHIAEEALKLIEVEYEPLTPVLDVREAMKPGAILVDETLTTGEATSAFGKGKDSGVRSNVATHVRFKKGDVDKGFQLADVTVEREFTTRPVHQGYIEPHASTAFWAPDGRVTIWTSTQGAFGIRSQAASLLNLPESRVRVIPLEIGGGFGGKISSYLDAVAALLSRKTGQPVKIVMSRREVFEGSGPASGTYMRCKMGASRDGKITAATLYLAFEAGAFPGSPVGAAASTSLAPYQVPNFLVDGYDVLVNKPKVAAYRAPGAPQGAFAVESVVDELAEKLGMDPIEFRLKNAPHAGDRQVTGVPFQRIGCVEVEEAVRSHPHYTAPLEGPNRGRGVAVGFWFNGGMQSSATINVNDDGTVSLITGSVDIGGTRASLAMQAAEVLGIRAEDVVPSVADTDSVGFTAVTGGSRTTFSTGIAVIGAAEEIKKKMVGRAALIWETEPADVNVDDGVFSSRKDPLKRLTFKDLARQQGRTGGPIGASASSSPKGAGPAFAAMLVDVEVDPETGKVDILRLTAFQDVGKAAHPAYAEGQAQGGTAQGIGWALNEEYFYNGSGAMVNSSFLDYRMPTSLDLPPIESVLIEVPNPTHPFGIRGVGEVSIVPPMAAVANAIRGAVGIRLASLPMNPGAVLDALEPADRVS